MKKLFLNCLLFIISCNAIAAIQPDELLLPDEAFKLSAQAVGDKQIKLDWDIAEGYYLYHDQLSIQSVTPDITITQQNLSFPKGKTKLDQIFGETTIYTDHLSLAVPLEYTSGNTVSHIEVEARYQGCYKKGLCFPPQTKRLNLSLADTASNTADIMPLSQINHNAPHVKRIVRSSSELTEPVLTPELTPKNPHPFEYTLLGLDKHTLLAQWTIQPGHHLYQSKIQFEVKSPEGVSLGKPIFPPGQVVNDEFLGRMHLYQDSLNVSIPLDLNNATQNQADELLILTHYQGCSDNTGLCSDIITAQDTIKISTLPEKITPTLLAGFSLTSPNSNTEGVRDTDYFSKIQSSGFFGTIALFFGGGLLLALTPCIFPMIPILSGIIVGQGNISVYKAFLLSVVYVVASATAYAMIGIAFGLFGSNLQTVLQHPIAISLFAALFVALGLSMFGFYDLQMPASLQNRLNELSNQQQGGSLIGAAIMGFLSTLIVGPCVAPPLAGALTYIAQTKDALLGGLALFFMGIGMGVPLVIVGISAGHLLPRAGAWMDTTKAIFGIIMMGLAIWMLDRIVPIQVTMALTGTLLVASGIHMGALDKPDNETGGWGRFWRSIGLILLLYGTTQFLGVATGSTNLWQPLKGVFSPTEAVARTEPISNKPKFQVIKNIDDLNRMLEFAKQNQQPVMLDFYADWCLDCKRMDKNVFENPAISTAMQNILLLKADVTAGDSEDKTLEKHLGIIAPPSIVFFDKNTNEIKDIRLIGYEDTADFSRRLQAALNR